MPEPQRVGDLDINQDLEHERREGILRTAGWVFCILLLSGALMGLFGRGVLSSAEAGQRGAGLWVQYQRFERRHSGSRLRVHLGPAVSQNGAVRLWLDRRLLDRVSIQRIQPEPNRQALATDRSFFDFDVSPSQGALAVTFWLEPETTGPISTSLGIENGPELQISQFVFP